MVKVYMYMIQVIVNVPKHMVNSHGKVALDMSRGTIYMPMYTITMSWRLISCSYIFCHAMGDIYHVLGTVTMPYDRCIRGTYIMPV
jgi:hypothetical protein